MKPITKIIGAFALIGGAFGISRLFKRSEVKETIKKISITVSGVAKPKIKNGALSLSVNISLDNPTNNTLSLKKPYITAYFGGKVVGNSIPSNERTAVKANERTTITGINIQIPFYKLGLLVVRLVLGEIPKMAFDIEVTTEAGGIAYTDKKPFQL
jgi:hypothetical protein